jgi:Uncharacterized protein conserved in bacteria
MFMILLKYVKPLEEIDKLLTAHADFQAKYFQEASFLVAGRMQPRVGGVLIAKAESAQELWNIIRQDPFYANDAAEYEVIEFIPGKTLAGLARYFC